MIAAPWYLLAVGVGLVILGYFVEGFSGSSNARQPRIHHKMRDKDIVKSLKDQETMPKSAVIALLGYLLIGVSIIWRIAEYFV